MMYFNRGLSYKNTIPCQGLSFKIKEPKISVASCCTFQVPMRPLYLMAVAVASQIDCTSICMRDLTSWLSSTSSIQLLRKAKAKTRDGFGYPLGFWKFHRVIGFVKLIMVLFSFFAIFDDFLKWRKPKALITSKNHQIVWQKILRIFF